MDRDLASSNIEFPTTGHFEIGVMEGAIANQGVLASVVAHLQSAHFTPVGRDAAPEVIASLDVVILPADLGPRLESLLAEMAGRTKTVVVLEDTSIGASRRLFGLGATDILPAPVTESALILSLERIMRTGPSPAASPAPTGTIVAMLKAGGGVGATFLATQVAAQRARQNAGLVCGADFDIQFGSMAEYLDVGPTLSATDIIGNPGAFSDQALAKALIQHPSGCRIMGAPKDVTPLEVLSAEHADAIIAGLKRSFATTIIDLPAVWTQWSYRTLQLCDRIILVSHLSVPHMQLIKRQLRVLVAQKLDDKPLTLVLNAVSKEQLETLPLKTAETAVGRPFDLVIPMDERTANLAVNQGLELNAVKRGAKITTAVDQLASLATTGVLAPAQNTGFNIKFW